MKETLQTSLEEAKSRLSSIDEIAKRIRRNLEDERKNGIPHQHVLEEIMAKLVAEEEQLTRKLKKAKAICKKRKQEIVQWQTWFKELNQENKAEEKKQLENELEWRQKEVVQQEVKISHLYGLRTEKELEKSEKEVQLEALKRGVHKLPIDQDPRLSGILEEKKELQRIINPDLSTFNISSNGQ